MKDYEIYSKSNQEKFDSIKEFKSKGDLALKDNELDKACFMYQQALVYVTYLIPSDDEQKEYFDLEGKIYMNLSLVAIKSKEYRKAL